MEINIIKKSNNKIVELRKGITGGVFIREKNNEIRIMFFTKKGRFTFQDYDIENYYFKEVI